MQSVVRVDPYQVKDWVGGLLNDQAQGKTEQFAYTPSKTTVDVVNDTDINGLAASVSEVLTDKGFCRGNVGNNATGHVRAPRCRRPSPMTLAPRRFPRSSAGSPSSLTLRWLRARREWCWPATTPARVRASARSSPATLTRPGRIPGSGEPHAPASPVLTAGANDPACVN